MVIRPLVALTAAALLSPCAFGQQGQGWSSVVLRPDDIIVTPADLSGQKYEVLGPVEATTGQRFSLVPGDNFGRSVSECGPNQIRAATWEKYGGRAGAVIGFTQWRVGSEPRCGGTAVRLILPDDPSRPTPNTAPNLNDGSLSPGKLRE